MPIAIPNSNCILFVWIKPYSLWEALKFYQVQDYHLAASINCEAAAILIKLHEQSTGALTTEFTKDFPYRANAREKSEAHSFFAVDKAALV